MNPVPFLRVLALALCEDDLGAVRALIRRTLKPDVRTLDLGCGPGLFADLFAQGDYVGIDPRPPFVDYARRHRPGTFLCEALAPVAVPAGRFDQALAFDVLRQRSDTDSRTILVELGRLLAPGGRALLIEREAEGARVEHLARTLGRVARPEALKSGFRRRVALVCATST
jgi:SAM-dependent methyltransferase